MELKVNLKENSYFVKIEKGIINSVSNYLGKDKKIMIITDDNIPFSIIEKVKKQFDNPLVFTIPHGEKGKSFSQYKKINECLLDHKFSKKDYLIGIGGGVVTDLTGFVAATFKRGMNFINIPTSTLAMIDASIGGKTAINFKNVKNCIGAIKQPKAVFIDIETLETLPKRHYINGLIEALKMGIILDKDLFELFKGDYDVHLEEIIIKSVQGKISVVEQDEKEENLRKILNFGHTFGHALESYFSMRKYYHGECVGLGMLIVSKNTSYYDDLLLILKRMDLKLDYVCDKEKIIDLIFNDKKSSNNNVDLILVNEIGKAEIVSTKIEELIKYLG